MIGKLVQVFGLVTGISPPSHSNMAAFTGFFLQQMDGEGVGAVTCEHTDGVIFVRTDSLVPQLGATAYCGQPILA